METALLVGFIILIVHLWQKISNSKKDEWLDNAEQKYEDLKSKHIRNKETIKSEFKKVNDDIKDTINKIKKGE